MNSRDWELFGFWPSWKGNVRELLAGWQGSNDKQHCVRDCLKAAFLDLFYLFYVLILLIDQSLNMYTHFQNIDFKYSIEKRF